MTRLLVLLVPVALVACGGAPEAPPAPASLMEDAPALAASSTTRSDAAPVELVAPSVEQHDDAPPAPSVEPPPVEPPPPVASDPPPAAAPPPPAVVEPAPEPEPEQPSTVECTDAASCASCAESGAECTMRACDDVSDCDGLPAGLVCRPFIDGGLPVCRAPRLERHDLCPVDENLHQQNVSPCEPGLLCVPYAGRLRCEPV